MYILTYFLWYLSSQFYYLLNDVSKYCCMSDISAVSYLGLHCLLTPVCPSTWQIILYIKNILERLAINILLRSQILKSICVIGRQNNIAAILVELIRPVHCTLRKRCQWCAMSGGLLRSSVNLFRLWIWIHIFLQNKDISRKSTTYWQAV